MSRDTTGVLAVRLRGRRDRDGFDEFAVSVDAVRVDRADGGTVERDVDADPVDLAALSPGISRPIAEVDLPVGEYVSVTLDLGDVRVDPSGPEVRVDAPSSPAVNRRFAVDAGRTTAVSVGLSPVPAGVQRTFLLSVPDGESCGLKRAFGLDEDACRQSLPPVQSREVATYRLEPDAGATGVWNQ